MYKVLIVDDEKMIRMGMKKVIPWLSLGIQQVYTAATGMRPCPCWRSTSLRLCYRYTDVRNDGAGIDRKGQKHPAGFKSNRADWL